MKNLEFLQERINETKKEIKERKKWKKGIEHELDLERTYKYHQEDSYKKMWEIANIMIKHYENILREQEEMLKECKEVR